MITKQSFKKLLMLLKYGDWEGNGDKERIRFFNKK